MQKMKPGVIHACIGALAVCLLHVPLMSGEKIPSNEQLSNQDVKDIIALLGRQGNEEDKEASASDPVPSIVSSPNGASANNNNEASLNPGAASPALNQDEIAQSLALLSTLFSSGQSSPDLSALLGAAAVNPTTTTTTTTTTTENPKDAEAAAAQLLNALLAGNGDGGGIGGTDAGNLAALLSLATAANPNTQQQQQKQQQQQQGNKLSTTDAQNAALLTNLLLSAGGAGASQAGGVKQQDFQSFQNAGANLDPSSSNQLSGALNLLSTLGTLGSLGNPQPSLFNLGGQQNTGGGLLSGLLRGATGGGQSGLLGLLAPQQQQRPGLLSSLGTLASVVGSTLGGVRNSLGTGPAKLRGVDTRLGLGYRFGENADAQVLWEIGPQLFTEPLTDEQKQQLRIQQEQLRLQQLQLEQQKQAANKNPNRRLMVDRRRIVRRPTPFIPNGKTLARRHVMSTPTQLQQLPQQIIQPPVVKAMPPTSKPSTLEQLLQPPPSYYRTSRPSVTVRREPEKTNQLNYYAKEEANPLTNVNSQLTEYERWLLHSPHRSQIHQQQYVVNSPAPKQRRDTFTFTKDSNKNIVRMRVQPRKNLNQVQVIQAVGGIRNENGMQPMNPVAFSSRMGFQRRSNPGADDSYLRRNAIAFNPRLRDIHREQALQEEQVRNLQRRQREQERRNFQRQQKQQEREMERMRILEGLQNQPDYQSKPKVIIPSTSSSSLPSGLVRNIQKNANRRIAPQRRRKTSVKRKEQEKEVPKTLSEWSENTSFTDMVSNYVINKLKSTGNTVVRTIVPGASLNLDDDLTKIEDDDDDLENSGSGFKAVIKGFLGVGQPGPKPPPPKKPIIKIGEEVAYDELRTIVSGGKLPGTEVYKIPTLSDSAEIMAEASAKEKFPAPTPEIFIDIANGEVSMRKAFGTMESFTPPPPEYIPEDHPRHVFKVLKDQLAQQYEKIKQQQLKEAAKQIRKENIANGLSNPHDPLYMAANMNMFDLVEKESKK